MTTRLPPRTVGPILGLAYLIAWMLLLLVMPKYWMIPAGLRFGALLLTRPRQWPWLVAGEWMALALHELSVQPDNAWTAAFFLGDAASILVVCASLFGLRSVALKYTLRTPEDVARLLSCALLVAIACTLASFALADLVHPILALAGIGSAIGGELLREYLGSLLVAPFMIMLVRDFPDRQELGRVLLETLFILVPSLAFLLTLLESPPPLPGFARILALAPVLLFAFRHGWRGASFSMLLVNGGMMAFAGLRLGRLPPPESLLFLGVAGTGALLLGAASDALRRSSQRLSVQNARLEGANRRLDHLAQQLSDVARRNLRTEEEQRRYVAAELHDELGQNLTAIQTRVKLAQSRLREAGLADVSTSINDILAHMRAAVRRLLNNLRPTVLDEFGLASALKEGPIHDLLKAAGIDYRIQLHGNLLDLDEDTRITVYRVVQEAATNTVRHAMAGHFSLRLRSGLRQGRPLVLLDLRDDGVGLTGKGPSPRNGHGLQSMRDRVAALGGILHVHTGGRGTRLRILLPAGRQDT